MINEKEKRLALLNGEKDALYKQNIIKGIRLNYPSVDDELAILRKIVVILAQKVKEQHPDIDFSELIDYNMYVENIKNEVKDKIGG